MIVFTIAFGERYIRQFFERCLPSLFGPDRPCDTGGEKLRLIVFTLKRDESLVLSHARNASFPGKIQIHSIEGRVMTEAGASADLTGISGGDISGELLTHAMKLCIQENEVFLHTQADLVYAPGTVTTCYHLHRITGKIVALFNGRVSPKDDAPDPTTEELMRVSRTPAAMVDYLSANMMLKWQDHTSSDLNVVPGLDPGFMIYRNAGLRFFFSSNPNPFIGRFRPSDIPKFANKAGFNNWDNTWKDALLQENRLFVQTNLDLGMCIETTPRESRDKQRFMDTVLRTKFENALILAGGNETDVRREAKFGAVQTFCFTSAAKA